MVKQFLTLESRQSNEERIVFSIKYAVSTRYPRAKEKKDIALTPLYKINQLKMVQYQNGRVKTMKFLEKTTGVNLSDFSQSIFE